MPSVRATAPCRVDLAGGTLDIWPLGLLHPGSCTVNVAIGLEVCVELSVRGEGYVVVSGDERVEGRTIDDLLEHDSARLAGRVLGHAGCGPVQVEFESQSPRNAGLGASSSLCVALVAACRALQREPAFSTRSLVHIARDLEARLMSLPTGIQDHYPAVLGGVLEIAHRVGGESVRRLDVDQDALGESLTVVYSGRSHFSAGNNFEVVSRRLQDDAVTRQAMDDIAAAASAMGPALEAGDLALAGQLMGAEMEARRRLSSVVSTPEVEDVLTRAAAAGAWGSKVCGAGGGGCIAILSPPDRRDGVAQRLAGGGYRVLPTGPARAGLEVTVAEEAS